MDTKSSLIELSINTEQLSKILSNLERGIIETKQSTKDFGLKLEKVDTVKDQLNESLLKVEAAEGKFMGLFHSVDEITNKIREFELGLGSFRTMNSMYIKGLEDLKKEHSERIDALEERLKLTISNYATKDDIEKINKEIVSLENKALQVYTKFINIEGIVEQQNVKLKDETDVLQKFKNDVKETVDLLKTETTQQGKNGMDSLKNTTSVFTHKIEYIKKHQEKIQEELSKVCIFLESSGLPKYEPELKSITDGDNDYNNKDAGNNIIIEESKIDELCDSIEEENFEAKELGSESSCNDIDAPKKRMSKFNSKPDIHNDQEKSSNADDNRISKLELRQNSKNLGTSPAISKRFSRQKTVNYYIKDNNQESQVSRDIHHNSNAVNLASFINLQSVVKQVESKLQEIRQEVNELNRNLEILDKRTQSKNRFSNNKPIRLQSINNISTSSNPINPVTNQESTKKITKPSLPTNDNKDNNESSHEEEDNTLKRGIQIGTSSINIKEIMHLLKTDIEKQVHDIYNSRVSYVKAGEFKEEAMKDNSTTVQDTSNRILNNLMQSNSYMEKKVFELNSSIALMKENFARDLEDREALQYKKINSQISKEVEKHISGLKAEMNFKNDNLNKDVDQLITGLDSAKASIKLTLYNYEELNVMVKNISSIIGKDEKKSNLIKEVNPKEKGSVKEFLKGLMITLKKLAEFTEKIHHKQENMLLMISQKLRLEMKEESVTLSANLTKDIRSIAEKFSIEVKNKADSKLIENLITDIENKFKAEITKKLDKTEVKKSQLSLTKKVSSIIKIQMDYLETKLAKTFVDTLIEIKCSEVPLLVKNINGSSCSGNAKCLMCSSDQEWKYNIKDEHKRAEAMFNNEKIKTIKDIQVQASKLGFGSYSKFLELCNENQVLSELNDSCYQTGFTTEADAIKSVGVSTTKSTGIQSGFAKNQYSLPNLTVSTTFDKNLKKIEPNQTNLKSFAVGKSKRSGTKVSSHRESNNILTEDSQSYGQQLPGISYIKSKN